jgi:hypothetical protein
MTATRKGFGESGAAGELFKKDFPISKRRRYSRSALLFIAGHARFYWAAAILSSQNRLFLSVLGSF